MLTTTALVPALVPGLGAAPASAAVALEVEVVADGLDNPRGLAFGPDGALYVVEAGSSGDSPCVTALGGEACLGATGAVTRVDLDTQTHERVAEGLPNLFLAGEVEGTGEAVGPSDVRVTDDGQLLVTIGLGADPAVRDELGDPGARLGTLVTIDPADGSVEQVADLAGFEAEQNPDESDPPDSNPNGLLVRGGEVLVADAGANAVFSVGAGGAVSTVAVFPSRTVTVPGLPPDLPMDAVPTSIAEGAAGQVLVGELTGFPFPQGGALVRSLDPTADRPVEPQEFFGGFTNIMDVLQRDDDTFVLEIATNSLLSGPAAVGALARLRPDGSTQRVGEDDLRFPAGMTLGPDGAIYISNNGTSAGTGQVVRIDPSQAIDPAIQAACPPDDMAFPPFDDIDTSVHEEAVACLWWWDITTGTTGSTFSPEGQLTRGQAASLLVRAAERTGATLPTSVPDAFTDDEGSVHEDAINVLAAVDVLLGTADGQSALDQPVTRGQLVSLVSRAAAAFGVPELPVGEDAFDDDDGSVHEEAINRAATAGWIVGDAEGNARPGAQVTRAQASSILARALSTLVEAGDITLPDPVSPPL